jgi:hypothetical protein
MATWNLYPSGAGDLTTWIPLSSTNWSNVDETGANDGDTSYVSWTGTTATNDLYNLINDTGNFLSGAQTISGIDVIVYSKYVSAGSAGSTPSAPTLNILIKPTGYSVVTGSNYTVTTAYVPFTGTWTTNPSGGGAWTQATLNGLQAGIRSAKTQGSSSRTRTPYVTQIYVRVNYLSALPANAGKAKVYVASSWESKPIKVYVGGSWVVKSGKFYDGGAWQYINRT